MDCIRDQRAHEIKMRVTIAASGQGRWREELEFPADCKASDFLPVLVVLDPTPNDKLAELSGKFVDEGGEVYIGGTAWKYLHSLAGGTMAQFLERYVHEPLQAVLAALPDTPEELPELRLKMERERFIASLQDGTYLVKRTPRPEEGSDPDGLPDDVDEEVPGP